MTFTTLIRARTLRASVSWASMDPAGWCGGSYPFARPHRGILGPDSVAYPLNLECGTARQRKAEIEVGIYDTSAAQSQPVAVDLACYGD